MIMRLKQLAPYLLITSFLFVFAFGLGFWGAARFPEAAKIIIQGVMERFSEARDLSAFETFIFILRTNIVATSLMVLLGFFFGLAPLFVVLLNGFLIGVVASVGASLSGGATIAIGLLPHGIIEIPAFILAASLGLRLGVKFVRLLFLQEPFRKEFGNTALYYLAVIIPLLIAAAFVETYVTGYLLEKVITKSL